MWEVGPCAAPEAGMSGFVCYPHCPTAQCLMNDVVTEVCGYVGGPARLAGPQGATRSLSKLIKTLQALAYSQAQASLFSNQCLHCCRFALHLPNIGQNYRAVTHRTMLK